MSISYHKNAKTTVLMRCQIKESSEKPRGCESSAEINTFESIN